MTVIAPAPDDALRDRLLAGLAHFRADPRRGDAAGTCHFSADLFRYCAFCRERIASVELEHASIGIVLSGRKEVWFGDAGITLEAGTVFVLPGRVPLDVVNIPDAGRDVYESLLMPVPHLPQALRGMASPVRAGAGITVDLTPERVDALIHAAQALAGSAQAAAVAELRLTEVLMLLSGEPAAAPLFATTLTERVRWLVRSRPEADWTAAEIGRQLAVGASTLRRRLAQEGVSLRGLMRDERMALAGGLIGAGGLSVAQAAQAVGYASRSHFARRFRDHHGDVPRGHRAPVAGRG